MNARRTLTCFALAAITLAACSGDDDAGDATAEDSTAEDSTAEDSTAGDDTAGDDTGTGDAETGDAGTGAGETADAGETTDGGDTGGDDGETGATDENAGETDGDTADETAGDVGETGDDGDGAGAGGDGGAGIDLTCEDLFTTAEIEEFFGEPVEITYDSIENIGQVMCTWETIEDPEDLEDLAFQLITVQVFTGDPVPAENFIDPDMFDEVTPIEDVGDLAFSEDTYGRSYYFLDGSVAGVLNYTSLDLGDTGEQPTHTDDEVEQLFRTLHDRVT